MIPMRVSMRAAPTPATELHPTGVGHCVRLRSWIAVFALLASLADANASSCLPSAAAVRQESPQAWPSWTLRAPGHQGTKCWYASRTRTPDRKYQTVQREEKIAMAETIRTQSTTNGLYANPYAAAAQIDAESVPSPTPQSLFSDRFSAVFDGNLSVEWTNLQRVLDLFKSAARAARDGS